MRATATKAQTRVRGEPWTALQVLVLVLFFVTGAAGLVYEVAWTRLLTSLFGASSPAISTVLTAYMFGLALGGILFGRLADRSPHTLLLFALLEGGIALYALALPWLVRSSTGLYVFFYRSLQEQTTVLNLVRFLHAFLLLILPTTLMGGTLPLLTTYLARSNQATGKQVAVLYGINTLGAAMGCVIAGFVLIEGLGVSGATRVAAITQIVVALVILVPRKWWRTAERSEPSLPDLNQGRAKKVKPSRRATTSRQAQQQSRARGGRQIVVPSRLSPRILALVTIGYSGFAALSLENLWTRLLTFFLGNTVYAFTSVLATVLVGIALGSLLARRLLVRMQDPLRLLGILQLGIGLCTLLLLPVQWRLNAVRTAVFDLTGGLGWWQLTAAKFAVTAVALLIPTLGMGASFPCAIAAGSGEAQRRGQFVGTVNAVNSGCGAVGSVITAFVLVPLMGVQRSIALFAVLSIAVGTTLLTLRALSTRLRVLQVAGAVALVVILLMIIRTDRPLISIAGVPQGFAPPYRLVDYREGVDSTIAVLEDAVGVRELSINGVSTAFTSSWDLRIHKLLAHLPLVLHPQPEKVLVVGYGMGVTARSSLRYPTVQHVDVVEISPEVMAVSPRFEAVNHGGLQDPRLRVIINDGKNHLLATSERYDMISTNAIHPGVSAGNGALYTVDFYQEMRDHLDADGVACQWLPIHQLSTDDVRTLMRSFQVVFPETSVWFASDFALLIGTARPLSLDLDQIADRLSAPSVQADLAELEDLAISDVADFVGTFLMDAPAVAECVGQAALNTDDHPLIEFTSPRSSFLSEETNWANLDMLYRFNRIGAAPIVAGQPERRAALGRRNESNREVLLGQLEAYAGRPDQALQHYMQALAVDSANVDARYLAKRVFIAQGLQAFEQGDYGAAVTAYDRALELAPDYAEGFYRLAMATDKGGDKEKALGSLMRAVELSPDNARWRVDLAGYYMQRNELQLALAELQAAVRIDPQYGEARVFLSIVYRRLGREAESEAELAEAMRLEREFGKGWQ